MSDSHDHDNRDRMQSARIAASLEVLFTTKLEHEAESAVNVIADSITCPCMARATIDLVSRVAAATLVSMMGADNDEMLCLGPVPPEHEHAPDVAALRIITCIANGDTDTANALITASTHDQESTGHMLASAIKLARGFSNGSGE